MSRIASSFARSSPASGSGSLLVTGEDVLQLARRAQVADLIDADRSQVITVSVLVRRHLSLTRIGIAHLLDQRGIGGKGLADDALDKVRRDELHHETPDVSVRDQRRILHRRFETLA